MERKKFTQMDIQNQARDLRDPFGSYGFMEDIGEIM